MPAWSSEELRNFIKVAPEDLIGTLLDYWKKDANTAVTAPQADTRSQLLDLITKRFNIVGGRIRHILSTGKSLKDLDRLLMESVKKLEFDDLVSIDEIDLSGNAPSLCYTIIPACRSETNENADQKIISSKVIDPTEDDTNSTSNEPKMQVQVDNRKSFCSSSSKKQLRRVMKMHRRATDPVARRQRRVTLFPKCRLKLRNVSILFSFHLFKSRCVGSYRLLLKESGRVGKKMTLRKLKMTKT